jgi:hypothetical protein
MRRQVAEAGCISVDVMQPKDTIAVRQQEIHWRIGHEIAGRDKCQQPGPVTISVDDAKVAFQRHGTAENLTCFLRPAKGVQDRCKIEHGGGIRAVLGDPLHQFVPERGDVAFGEEVRDDRLHPHDPASLVHLDNVAAGSDKRH